MRDSIAGASAAAAASGARIVHACGYDAVPSDLAVLLLHTEAAGAGLTDTVLVARARGGLSGGTVDSLRAQLDAVRADPSLRRVLADPYSLSPDPAGEPVVGPQPDAFGPRRDPLLGEWSVPSVMGPFDTRIVRRSNALMGWAYGRDFRYREVMTFGRRPDGAVAAAAVAGGMGGLLAAMRFGPSRWVLDRALPAPGAGPSEAALR
ncbi:enoyl-ACP reductase, partial [Acidimicrobiaceae bacterium USS-CC1]|nr:enoyl-ACP reductase [Acidiferrimicrobium australe]